jgi:hypothetical protein
MGDLDGTWAGLKFETAWKVMKAGIKNPKPIARSLNSPCIDQTK